MVFLSSKLFTSELNVDQLFRDRIPDLFICDGEPTVSTHSTRNMKSNEQE